MEEVPRAGLSISATSCFKTRVRIKMMVILFEVHKLIKFIHTRRNKTGPNIA